MDLLTHFPDQSEMPVAHGRRPRFPTMDLNFLKPEDLAWSSALSELDHDVYHCADYLAFAASAHGGEPEAALIRMGEDLLFLPYLVRSISDTAWLAEVGKDAYDIYTPYGYASPIFRGSNEFLCSAITKLRHGMQERGYVSGFIRLHPFLEFPRPLLESSETFVCRGDTVAFDLRKSEAELWSGIRHNHRRHINASVRQGLELFEDTEFRCLDDFMAMYEATMRRVSATNFYFFPRSYYESLRSRLGQGVRLFIVRSASGEPLAGGVFFTCGKIMQYHLGGTHDHALEMRPSKLMLHQAALWGKRNGLQFLHLGGGLGARRDELFQFKAGFSDLILPHYTWHLVLDEKRYQNLLERRNTALGPNPDSLFFPSYRAYPAPVDASANSTLKV